MTLGLLEPVYGLATFRFHCAVLSPKIRVISSYHHWFLTIHIFVNFANFRSILSDLWIVGRIFPKKAWKKSISYVLANLLDKSEVPSTSYISKTPWPYGGECNKHKKHKHQILPILQRILDHLVVSVMNTINAETKNGQNFRCHPQPLISLTVTKRWLLVGCVWTVLTFFSCASRFQTCVRPWEKRGRKETTSKAEEVDELPPQIICAYSHFVLPFQIRVCLAHTIDSTFPNQTCVQATGSSRRPRETMGEGGGLGINRSCASTKYQVRVLGAYLPRSRFLRIGILRR